jgi:RNA polymerase sigma-70 factor (ECF subfamily)
VEDQTVIYEQTIVPHLDAAYNLARWLAGNEHDAQDIVQESCLRAVKFFGSFRGGNPRAWLLTIVRNTSYTWLKRRNDGHARLNLDDGEFEIEDHAMNPAILQTAMANVETVRAAIAQLPPEFREIVVLREMEDYSYKEIADLTEAPIGTVMSRLARGRKQLQKILCAETQTSGGQP